MSKNIKLKNLIEKKEVHEVSELALTMGLGLLLKGIYNWVKKNPQFKQKLKDFVKKL
tara:strand:- start:206 stop:376 length:171 start_codon:yes stop_codon:yes gene_type:complete